jgi:hypothetical protein
VRFGYYRDLPQKHRRIYDKSDRDLPQKHRRIYDKSDAIGAIALPRLAEHRQRTEALRVALASENRRLVNEAAQALATGIAKSLGAPNLDVRVLARRPKNHEGELHGLYTLEVDGSAHIEVWMRTAAHVRVVAFRTFLRTLAHEVCHHLDLTLYKLGETFHTEGFFRRESSLVRQLLPASPDNRKKGPADKPKPKTKPPSGTKKKASRRAVQLTLFGS